MTGEVGLSGEIRPVSRIEQRIAEAHKLGFTKIIIPEHNRKQLTAVKHGIEIIGVKKVEEAFRVLFG
jgi:DNA repair protein RadA/Sms